MENDKFWNKPDGIRGQIISFVTGSALFKNFSAAQREELENSLIELFKQNKEIIYREVDREYKREDVVSRLENTLGYSEELADKVPFDAIDGIVSDWYESISNSQDYFDAMWESLNETIKSYHSYLELDGNIPLNVDDEDEAKTIYVAYLNDWFENHDCRFEAPVCISEFLDCEMQDEELEEYYRSIAASLFESED